VHRRVPLPSVDTDEHNTFIPYLPVDFGNASANPSPYVRHVSQEKYLNMMLSRMRLPSVDTSIPNFPEDDCKTSADTPRTSVDHPPPYVPHLSWGKRLS
jgi:hypothetical protein